MIGQVSHADQNAASPRSGCGSDHRRGMLEADLYTVGHVEPVVAPNASATRLCVDVATAYPVISMVLKVAVSLAAVVVLAACTPGPDRASDGDEILVSAAASLTDVFSEIEATFEDQNPGVDVLLNLAGSATLSSQIVEGAPADVFASASITNMIPVVEAGRASTEPEIFALNDMQIAVPLGNPGEVTGLDDFSNEALLLGVCTAGVPCGDLARDVFAMAGVDASIDTNEPNVRALLTKIELDELDAGIVYTTDVKASDTVEGIEIPPQFNTSTGYSIVALSDAGNPEGAATFVTFVQSPEGREILTRYGFSTP